MTVLKCLFIQGAAGVPSYGAADDRNMMAGLFGGTNFENIAPGIGAIARGHGVLSSGAMLVTANGTPNNHVFVAPGMAMVRGTQNNDQGGYLCPLNASFDITVPAADATLDRKDLIVAQVKDAGFAAFTGDVWTPALVQGTPNASPQDPTVPEDCLVLARLLVRDSAEAGGTIVRTQDITDLRVQTRTNGGIIPVSAESAAAAALPGDAIWDMADSSLKIRNNANNAWTRVAARILKYQGYTPTFGGSVGTTNTKGGRFKVIDDTVIMHAFLQLGSDGNITSDLTVSLPSAYPAANPGDSIRYFGGARAFNSDVSQRWAGVGIIAKGGTALTAIGTGAQTTWSGTVPFNWAPNDAVDIFCEYETSG